ncbi:uncharacterized protein LOC131248803 isoform X2 [Magnolia sinica]|uniref:uncharacterized protein LOC131248803 isoform X2 n=1 Tax=Magnolia sinica TaxID=86752 RepID=UPI00265985CC|nr:uncharacterized protein LOC131248803 isoform X2 [Magnolia sinica]
MEATRVCYSSSSLVSFYSSWNHRYKSTKMIQSVLSFNPSISSSRISFPLRLKSLVLPGFNALTSTSRNLSFTPSSSSVSYTDGSSDSSSPSQSQSAESFFRSILSSMEVVYLSRNPTAKAILDLVRLSDGDHVCYDHLAFRTFGVDGHGIDSIAKIFLDFGYTPRDELRFPAKKLKALWFTPPDTQHNGSGSGVYGPLPRIFISELLVDEMSSQVQEVIRKYTKTSGSGNKHAALASALGSLTWGKPLYSDYQQLSRESEYAAWTLVNGYMVNHVTISTHRLKSKMRNIKDLNDFIEDNGFKLNSEGGILKVSPDGFLLQSSTVADLTSFHFADGITEAVPCSYIEFAERLVLPQYRNLPLEEANSTGGQGPSPLSCD